MWQAGECETKNGNRKRTRDNDEQKERKQRFDIVDLYEELLAKRAEMGHRPVLYVSSERDLECNLIGMFEQEISDDATGEAVPHSDSAEELRRRLQ